MPAAHRPPRIAVVGGSTADEDEAARARALGGALARRGAILLCGGHGGVMEAAAMGIPVALLGSGPAKGLDLPGFETAEEAVD